MQDDASSAPEYTTRSKTNELSLVFVRMVTEAAQEAPGPFVTGLVGPSHSWRGVLAGGPPDAPGVDGVFGTGGRIVWWCCRVCAGFLCDLFTTLSSFEMIWFVRITLI
ncbi:MAG: hypothetical protein U9N48_08315 [Euryarchaeota archaeon]|nr:hypothetical protein [Euryarchaeota archaeon]